MEKTTTPAFWKVPMGLAVNSFEVSWDCRTVNVYPKLFDIYTLCKFGLVRLNRLPKGQCPCESATQGHG
jgi:hypothetical protein